MTTIALTEAARVRRKWAFVLLFTTQPLLGVGYQIAAESAARMLGARTFGWNWLAELIQSPWAWAAVALDLAALASWVVVLSEFSLGVAFALTSTAYVLVIGASVLVFHEPLHGTQLLGGALILGGIALMIRGQGATKSTETGEHHDRD